MTRATFARLGVTYLVSRALVLGALQISYWMKPARSVASMLGSWDGGHYMTLATQGYGGRTPQGYSIRYAFFPAWPAMLRGVHSVLGGSLQTDGLVLAFLLSFGAVVGIWFVVASVLDADTAERTAVLFMFLPAAFVLSMVYSEPLFIATAAVCLFALQQKLWIVAGLSAALAGATRSAGIVLVACCVVAAVAELRTTRRWWPTLSALLLAPVGFVAWLVYQWNRVGTPFAFVHAEQRGWQNGNSWGLSTLRAMRTLVWSAHRFRTPWPLLVSLSTVLILAGVILLAMRYREVPTTWIVYTLGIVAIAWSAKDVWSVPRFLIPAFPALAMLVQRLPSRAYRVVLAGSAGVMAMSAILLLTPAQWKFPGAP